MQELVFQEGE